MNYSVVKFLSSVLQVFLALLTHGIAYVHMAFETLSGKRHVQVLERHTMKDFAHYMKWLVNKLYPQAEIIRLVLDNLPAHKPAALYVTFPPAEARRILKKTGVPFHTQTRQLAKYGRNRIERL